MASIERSDREISLQPSAKTRAFRGIARSATEELTAASYSVRSVHMTMHGNCTGACGELDDKSDRHMHMRYQFVSIAVGAETP